MGRCTGAGVKSFPIKSTNAETLLSVLQGTSGMIMRVEDYDAKV